MAVDTPNKPVAEDGEKVVTLKGDFSTGPSTGVTLEETGQTFIISDQGVNHETFTTGIVICSSPSFWAPKAHIYKNERDPLIQPCDCLAEQVAAIVV